MNVLVEMKHDKLAESKVAGKTTKLDQESSDTYMLLMDLLFSNRWM